MKIKQNWKAKLVIWMSVSINGIVIVIQDYYVNANLPEGSNGQWTCIGYIRYI